jgi:uncharacterized protein (DUF1778 family)
MTVLAREECEEVLAWLDEPPQVLPGMQRLADAERFEQR